MSDDLTLRMGELVTREGSITRHEPVRHTLVAEGFCSAANV